VHQSPRKFIRDWYNADVKLPLAPQANQPDKQQLVREIKRVQAILARTTAHETVLDGATAYTNPHRPGARLANTATDLQLPNNLAPNSLLDNIIHHYQQAGVNCYALSCAHLDWPPALADAAQNHGYTPSKLQVYHLAAYTPPEPPTPRNPSNQDIQIIPGRAAYPQLRQVFLTQASDHDHATPEQASQTTDALIDQLDEPRLEMFIARRGGQPLGIAGVVSLGQIGVIHNLYTPPQHRGTGIATALLQHTIELCARATFEQVILELPDACPSTSFYQSFGFNPVVSYLKYDWLGSPQPDHTAAPDP